MPTRNQPLQKVLLTLLLQLAIHSSLTLKDKLYWIPFSYTHSTTDSEHGFLKEPVPPVQAIHRKILRVIIISLFFQALSNCLMSGIQSILDGYLCPYLCRVDDGKPKWEDEIWWCGPNSQRWAYIRIMIKCLHRCTKSNIFVYKKFAVKINAFCNKLCQY